MASRHGCWDGVLKLSDLPQHPTQGPSSSSSSSSRWAGSWSCVPRVLPASGVLPFSPAGFWQGEVSGKTGCRECCLPRAQLGLPKGPRRTQRRAHVGLNCTSASSLPAKKAARMFYPCVCSPATAPGAVSNSPAAGGLGDVEINLFNSVPAAPRAGIANLLRSSRGSHAGLCALNPHEMSRLSRETREAGAQGTGDWPCRVRARAGVLLPWSSRWLCPLGRENGDRRNSAWCNLFLAALKSSRCSQGTATSF